MQHWQESHHHSTSYLPFYWSHPRNWDIRSADTLLSVFPFFHAGGLVFLLRFLSTGCSVIFMPSFEINHFLQTIEKFKVIWNPFSVYNWYKGSICTAYVKFRKSIISARCYFDCLLQTFLGHEFTTYTQYGLLFLSVVVQYRDSWLL